MSDESQFRIVLRGAGRSASGENRAASGRGRTGAARKIPADELETIVSSTGVLAQGRSSLFNPNTGPHTSVISVYLVTPDKRTRNQVQIMNDVRPKVLKLFPGVAMFFDPGGLVKRVTSFGSQKSVDVEIYGYDFEKAREVIRQVESLMHKIAGLADIEVSREENYPEVNVVVDREKAALLGISETDVANAVLFSLNGNGQTDPIIYTDPQNGNEYYISAWLAEEHRKDLTDIENIILTATKRRAGPAQERRLAQAERRPGQDRPQILSAGDPSSPPTLWIETLAPSPPTWRRASPRSNCPPASASGWPARFSSSEKHLQGLLFATVLALVLVYMVMAAQFKSLIDPFIIMFSVPMGFPGVILILVPDQHDPLHHLDDGHHHDAWHRGLERRPTGRLHERAEAKETGAP